MKTLRRSGLFACLFFLLLLVLFNGCGNGGSSSGRGDDPANPPYPGVPTTTSVAGAEMNLARIVRSWSEGKVARTPWAGYWFPYSQNGIRSAAAKYDQARGGSAGAAQWEVANHGSGIPGIQDWWGHCNGWAAAADLFAEPRQTRSAGGVSFSVADQKALLSEIAMEVRGDFFGQRYDGGSTSSGAFRDVYPNQFLLVLTNFVGRGLPLNMDRYTGSQVWNQPIAGYRLAPIGPEDSLGAAPDAPNIHRVRMSAEVWWVRDDVPPGAITGPFSFEENDSFESRTLRFEVWLDAPPVFGPDGKLASSGNIVLPRDGRTVYGGNWNTGELDLFNSYPDYLWAPTAVTPSSGYSNPRIDPSWVSAQFGGG